MHLEIEVILIIAQMNIMKYVDGASSFHTTRPHDVSFNFLVEDRCTKQQL